MSLPRQTVNSNLSVSRIVQTMFLVRITLTCTYSDIKYGASTEWITKSESEWAIKTQIMDGLLAASFHFSSKPSTFIGESTLFNFCWIKSQNWLFLSRLSDFGILHILKKFYCLAFFMKKIIF